MKKLLKQLICFVLIFIAAFSCFGNSDIIDDILIIASAATTASGTCGENVTWSFDADTATLTISGYGDMTDYATGESPWYEIASNIKHIVVSQGIISVGSWAFYNTDCTDITMASSVKIIRENAFNGSSKLRNIYYQGSISDWCEIKIESMGACLLYFADNLYINNELVSGHIVIPDGTTRIDEWAFAYYSKITGITIPSSVTLCEYNFDRVTNLEEVILNDGITEIEDYLFRDCSSLTSIVIPDSVTSIGDFAFCGCSALTEINIPETIKTIGRGAFNDTGAFNLSSNWDGSVFYIDNYLLESDTSIMGEYTIKKGTKLIADSAFFQCENLTEVYIPDTVLNVSKRMFSGCSNLLRVEIPDSIKSIGKYAFYNCINLESVTIGNNVENIDYYAFAKCSKLKSVIIPDSVNFLGDEVFYECTSLETVKIGAGVTELSWYLFQDCNSLKSITIPKNISYIDSTSFRYCPSLSFFYVDNSNDYYSVDEFGVLFNKDKTKLIRYPMGNTRESYVVPDGVLELEINAFDCCSYLKSITIPDVISKLPDGAFFKCTSLTHINIPDDITEIGEWAFYQCPLTTVFIPESVKNIKAWAFDKCLLLTDVYYTGSEYEWSLINIDSNNVSLINAEIHYDVQVNSISYDSSGCSIPSKKQVKIKDIDTEIYSFIPEKSLTVTFDANGGQVQTSKKTLDCTFESWNTAQDGNGTSYQPGSTYTADEDITLYAQWDNPEIGTLEIPTRDGYYFEGWYTDPYEGTKVTEMSVVSSDLTLYAHWNKLEVTGLKWVTKPAETEYFVGESLNTEGAEITATFNSGETKTIPLDEIEFYPTDFDRAGKKIVKATYGEKYVSFIVNVKNINLASVSVEKMPQKLVYTVGDKLDTSGLVLKVVYDDSSTKTITEGFSASCDIASSGTKAVTVNYTENGVTVSTSYQITVNPKVTEPDAVISADSVSVAAGEIISVPFRVENNKGFMGFAITVDYDSNAFTPVSVTPGAMLGNGTLNDSIGTAYKYLKIVYVGSDDVNGDGDLFTVDFVVNENASGNYNFDVSYLQPDTFNESLDDVVLKCNDFDVSVSNQAVEQSVIFVGGSVDTNAGTTVVVPVSVENGVGINSFSFKMDYNSEVMSFVSASNGDIITDGKVNSSINESYDEISLSWSGSPITTDGKLFYVTFEIDEYIQSYEILSVLCENITFANETTKDVICIDAEVNIFNPNGGNSPVIYSKDYLRIEDSIIEVPIYIKNNHGVMGFGMTFEYDSSIITPLSVTKGEMLSDGYFVDNIGSKDGSFKVLWNNSKNISLNGELFTLKFSVAEGAKPERVPLSIAYSQPDTYNENWEDVALNINIPEICISYIYTATFMHNGKVIGTDEFFPDDDSLDYPVMPEKPHYEWVWYEHEIKAEDITVEGKYLPVEYTISYYNGNALVATDKYTVETISDEIVLPQVPEKTGYTGKWNDFTLGTEDITVYCSYSPIRYTATFMYDGEVIGTDEFTIEDDSLDYPETENKEHYEWVWDEYIISASDLTVEGRYIPIEYTINFVSGGQTVKTQKYTVETLDSIMAPEPSLPAKEGYYSEWESWEGKTGNLTVNEVYVAREYTISFLCDGQIISQDKFTVETKADEIKLPEVPEKSGYTGEWNDFEIAAKDIEVKCKYTPVVYTATFICDGKMIGIDTFTVEDEALDYPYIAKWANYEWVWDEHKIQAGDLTIEGRYIPITYTITFVSNGKIIKTQEYNVETVDSVVAPEKSLPAKQHYTTEWENWKGKYGNITVNEVYVPIEYKISFYCQGKLTATRVYTIETSLSQIIIPGVPKVEGYTIKWPDVKLEYKNQTVNAICTPIVYSAQFVADGRVIATRTFTVETKKLYEPAIPQKPGYIAVWSNYTIKAQNITVFAKYYSPEVAMKAKVTMKTDETLRLFPSCNFEVTGKNWSTSNPDVATVDSHGKVTAVDKGKCDIYVTCYGKDSLGNEIKVTEKTEITVKEQLNAETLKERFRTAFDEFFQVKLYDFLYNYREFMILLFRYAY